MTGFIFDSDFINGDEVEAGALESLTSAITSSFETSSFNFLVPLAIWPGYQTVLANLFRDADSVERPISEEYRPPHIVK